MLLLFLAGVIGLGTYTVVDRVGGVLAACFGVALTMTLIVMAVAPAYEPPCNPQTQLPITHIQIQHLYRQEASGIALHQFANDEADRMTCQAGHLDVGEDG
jgi:hypothetical protein